jgi:hypothetical protein
VLSFARKVPFVMSWGARSNAASRSARGNHSSSAQGAVHVATAAGHLFSPATYTLERSDAW